VTTRYTDLQLDTLREVANIGSGTASTALAGLLGLPVDISVPNARALPIEEALEAIGDVDTEVTGVAIPVVGDILSVVLAVFEMTNGERLAELLGAGDDVELSRSALAEVSNILATHYLTSLHSMTGLTLEPDVPQVAADYLGAIVGSILLETLGDLDLCLFIDSELEVENESCSLSFLFVPGAGGADEVLARLGMA
jgi:chemotaxis protein CheC